MKNLYAIIGKSASLYDVALRVSGYEQSVSFFVSQLPFPENAKINVLDAGCGSGLYTLAILGRYRNARVVAFDTDKGLIDHLQEKLRQGNYTERARVFVGDITAELSEIKENFDLIITAGVLEYVPLTQSISNLSRFLLPGGYFFNSPLRTTVWGHVVARLYGCRPYPRKENLDAFKQEYGLEKIILLPPFRPASFKEGHLFRRSGS